VKKLTSFEVAKIDMAAGLGGFFIAEPAGSTACEFVRTPAGFLLGYNCGLHGQPRGMLVTNPVTPLENPDG
jgi:hypothetical protein